MFKPNQTHKGNAYQTERIAQFAHSVNFNVISQDIVEQLKRHLLDALGSLIQAQKAPAVLKLASQIRALKTGGDCYTPLLGNLPVDRAAQWYTALIRYPDFMDNFIGKEATCHPSDNIGPILAVCQNLGLTGRDCLLTMAVAYAIECQLVEKLPVMIKGFDHTVLYAYSITAALCKLYHLSVAQTTHALGMAGASFVPLVTSRAAYTYEWKGFASSMVALGCVNIVLMARENMTGPISVFEGPRGIAQIMEMKLEHDWSVNDLSIIRKCVLKSFNAEVHTQSSLEAALEIKKEYNPDCSQIESIDVTTFLTAYHIVGGGIYGDRHNVHSKEQADHSLPYVIAVILLDGEVYPGQFREERINNNDVQELIRKVHVGTVSPLHKPLPFAGFLDPYTDAYPEKLKTKLVIKMKNGEKISKEKNDYHGFYTRPFNWDDTVAKFKKLTAGLISEYAAGKIVEILKNFERHKVTELTGILEVLPVRRTFVVRD